MKVKTSLAASAAVLLVTASGTLSARQNAPAAPSPQSAVMSAGDARKVMDQYCVSCHNDRLKTAGLEQLRDFFDQFLLDARKLIAS